MFQVKKVSPNTIIVGRIYIADQPTFVRQENPKFFRLVFLWFEFSDGDPALRAQAWWDQVKKTIKANPDVDYWESYNEPPNTLEGIKWFAQFEVARMRLMTNNTDDQGQKI